MAVVFNHSLAQAEQQQAAKEVLHSTTIGALPIFEMWLGQQKGGKTFLCATASEAYPDNQGKKLGQQETFLHDMFWICADPNCLVGFKSAGLSVRHVDILDLMRKKKASTYFDAWKKSLDDAADACVKNPEIRTIVFDTPSNFDFFMGGYFRDKFVDSKNRYAVPQALLGCHAKLLEVLLTLPVDLRLLPCHGDLDQEVLEVMDGDNVTQSDRARTIPASMPGDNIIRPALTGKSVRNYQGLVDGVGTLECTVDIKGNFNRRILPFGGSGWRGGTRFHEVLSKTEEPNLWKLHNKIAEHANRFDKKEEINNG